MSETDSYFSDFGEFLLFFGLVICIFAAAIYGMYNQEQTVKIMCNDFVENDSCNYEKCVYKYFESDNNKEKYTFCMLTDGGLNEK